MESKRMFEIGFKDTPRQAGYAMKFNVVAETAEQAIEFGRKWLVEDFERWWDEDGQHDEDLGMTHEEARKANTDDLLLSRVYEAGEIIV